MTDNTNGSTPADRYFVGGAGLPATGRSEAFPYPNARRFQRVTLDWIHSDGDVPPISAVAAPTGGGKTALIAALADWAEMGAVCTYPTNALVEAQATALREINGYDLEVETVSGRTLSGTGAERSQELLDRAQNSGDILVTNPDVLQAVIQGSYFSPGNRIINFLEQFDAAVFDEFHYYDPLAASGLLMQIRLLAQRGQFLDRTGELQLPRMLLTSATPDETFVTSITEDFGIDAHIIRSRLISLDIADPAPDRVPPPDVELIYTAGGAPVASTTRRDDLPDDVTDPAVLEGHTPDGVSRFRSPMIVNRWTDWIGDAFERIARTLDETMADWNVGQEPTAAVVFNSAARSNAFEQYLHESWPELAKRTRKDNGYDTNAESAQLQAGEYAVLNTTSKGEVGLNFDLERLVVATPRTATALIQRVGRAARESPAIVDLYGLDDPAWPPVQSYAGLLTRILTVLPTPSTSRTRLRELAGLRAGRAIQKQFESNTWDPDIQAEFNPIPGHEKWKAFLQNLSEATTTLDGGLGSPTTNASGRQSIAAALEAVEGLDTLRGRSVNGQISYPRGEGRTVTEYDIIRALRHYPIRSVNGNVLRLGSETPEGTLSATYPGEPFGGIDVRQSDREINERLTNSYRVAATNGDFRRVDLRGDTLEYFFQLVSLQQTLLPVEIDTGRYRLRIDQDRGEISGVDERGV